MISGVAEHLPLRGHSADVVWMSTVFHQLTDGDQASTEVARVLHSEGVWLVRGFFSDRSRVGWLDWFPGADRAKATFPSAAEAVDGAERRGFVLAGAGEITSEGTATRADAAKWIRAMRSADTLLCALSDDEIAAGLAAMEVEPKAACPPNLLTLLVFRRP
jgi:ubiquinone/menaquinone biosynthesis C-methylase UbiE